MFDWLPKGARESLQKKSKSVIHCPIPGGVKGRTLDLSIQKTKQDKNDTLIQFLRGIGMPDDAAIKAASDVDHDTGDIIQAWTISTKRVDSYKDTVDPDGWELSDYQRNPVVLFAHNSHELPIGKDIGAWIESGKALRGVTQFASQDLNPLGHTVGKMVKAGLLNATSVGFEPVEFEESEDRDGSWMFPGIDFKKQILREYSVVPVPANPDCLADGRASGIDLSPIVQWAEKILDGSGGVFVSRTVLENVRRSALGNPLRVRVAEGLDLTPVPKAVPGELEDDEENKPEEPVDEEAKAEAQGMCPACGYEAELSSFTSAETPSAMEDESEEGEPLDDIGGGGDANKEASQDEVALQGLAERLALTVAREVQRQMMERTGRLP